MYVHDLIVSQKVIEIEQYMINLFVYFAQTLSIIAYSDFLIVAAKKGLRLYCYLKSSILNVICIRWRSSHKPTGMLILIAFMSMRQCLCEVCNKQKV